MMKNLWFASSLVLALTSCNSFICKNIQNSIAVNQNVASGFSDTLTVKQYETKISYKSTEITGILICKKVKEDALRGVFINEFGIKGFDFTLTAKGVKMGYVFKNLDKWYIRKTLGKDLHFVFYQPVDLSMCTVGDTAVYVAAVNRRLHYVYHKANENSMVRVDRYTAGRKTATMERATNVKKQNVIRLRHTDAALQYEFCNINKTQ